MSNQRIQFAIADLYEEKMEQNYKRLLANAHLKYPRASFHSIEYLQDRNLDKSTLLQLPTGNFLDHATDIAAFGISGSGKSFIACCIGTVACALGKRTLFYRMPDLLADYDCLETPQQRKRFVSKLSGMDLLILDEWLGTKLSETHINLIFEIVEKRTEVHSTACHTRLVCVSWRIHAVRKHLKNRIFSGLCKINCGNVNMRDYYSSSKLLI